MSLSIAIAVNLLAALGLLAGLVYVMSRPSRLRGHSGAGRRHLVAARGGVAGAPAGERATAREPAGAGAARARHGRRPRAGGVGAAT